MAGAPVQHWILLMAGAGAAVMLIVVVGIAWAAFRDCWRKRR